MNRNEFLSTFNDIINQFGNKYSDKKIDLIYRVVSKYSVNTFKQVCEQIIGDSRYAPTVSDFKELIRHHTPNNRGIIANDCTICSGHGYFTRSMARLNVITNKHFPSLHAFRCNCPNGDLYQMFQRWEGRFASYLWSKHNNGGLVGLHNGLQ